MARRAPTAPWCRRPSWPSRTSSRPSAASAGRGGTGRRCRWAAGSSSVVSPLSAPGEHLLEHVGAVGDQAVDAEIEELVHLRGLVDGPHVDVDARRVGPAYERTG